MEPAGFGFSLGVGERDKDPWVSVEPEGVPGMDPDERKLLNIFQKAVKLNGGNSGW